MYPDDLYHSLSLAKSELDFQTALAIVHVITHNKKVLVDYAACILYSVPNETATTPAPAPAPAPAPKKKKNKQLRVTTVIKLNVEREKKKKKT